MIENANKESRDLVEAHMSEWEQTLANLVNDTNQKVEAWLGMVNEGVKSLDASAASAQGAAKAAYEVEAKRHREVAESLQKTLQVRTALPR